MTYNLSSEFSGSVIHDDRDVPVFLHSKLDDLKLSPVQFRIYAHLVRRAGKGGLAWPGAKSISETCCIHEDSVWPAIKALCEMRLIMKIAEPGKSNRYRLTPMSEWNLEVSKAGSIDPLEKEGCPSISRDHPLEKEGLGSLEKEGCEGNPVRRSIEGNPKVRAKESFQRGKVESGKAPKTDFGVGFSTAYKFKTGNEYRWQQKDYVAAARIAKLAPIPRLAEIFDGAWGSANPFYRNCACNLSMFLSQFNVLAAAFPPGVKAQPPQSEKQKEWYEREFNNQPVVDVVGGYRPTPEQEAEARRIHGYHPSEA